MSYTDILYAVEDHILTITLNRPDRLNAFTGAMMHELIDAFDRADDDDGVRAIIVTGAGRGFCAGADLSAGAGTFDRSAEQRQKDQDDYWTHGDGGGRVSMRIFALKKPIIAAINGPAVGVGLTMTLPMDIRIAADTAKLGFVFVRRGMVPEACSSWFLPRIVGIGQALQWALSGRVFSAQEALEGGLVCSLHPVDDVVAEARRLATEIGENASAVSVALTRQMMWRMLGADDPIEAHKVDTRFTFARGASADAREGVASFLEKRKPAFTNKVSADLSEYFPWWEERPFE